MTKYLLKFLFDKTIVVNKFEKIITSIAYLCQFCFISKYAQEIFAGGQSWKTGDWLINYEGGFVRRGLIGQVLYYFSGLGISLLWLTFTIQVIIYLIIAHFTLKIFFYNNRGISWLLFLFSPAFIFLFPFFWSFLSTHIFYLQRSPSPLLWICPAGGARRPRRRRGCSASGGCGNRGLFLLLVSVLLAGEGQARL